MMYSLQSLRDYLALAASEDKSRRAPLAGHIRSYVDLVDMACGKAPRHIGVYGRPNAGKSSLLNSIAQEQILPVSNHQLTGSVIDLVRDPQMQGYNVHCSFENTPGIPMYFDTAEEVRIFLTSHACQKAPYDSVRITAAFPDAYPLFGENCILRDTPGAEHDSSDDELLQQDTRRAQKSLEEVHIRLFCVGCSEVGNKTVRDLYRASFADVLCLHVVTHADHISDTERRELENALRRTLDLSGSIAGINPIAMTGMSQARQSFVDVGMPELLAQVETLLSAELLETCLKRLARYLVETHDSQLGWNVCGTTRRALASLLT